MRYRAVISYFGASYVGWQRQLNGASVQEALENALSKVFARPTQATASGRTDAGVHAEGQVVHFDADTSIPVKKIPFAVNACLPRDISMLSCEIADENFNARFSAKRKTYRYKLYLSRHVHPLLEPTHAHVAVPLDLSLMRKACGEIQGTHDFKCFEASGSVVKNTVRTVFELKIDSYPLHGGAVSHEFTDGNSAFDCALEISVTGNGFLYNMVRIIAGTLVYVGMGKLTVADVRALLESGDRTKAGKTLPPQGLHLISVEY